MALLPVRGRLRVCRIVVSDGCRWPEAARQGVFPTRAYKGDGLDGSRAPLPARTLTPWGRLQQDSHRPGNDPVGPANEPNTDMSTVPPGKASEKIVRDTIRDGLRSTATDSSTTLDDPLAGSRDNSQFVLTSYPDRNVEYPHVVVREVGDSGERRDSRVDLWLHDYSVRVEMLARSATEAFMLRGGVKEWFQRNHDALRDSGFVDVSLSSSTPMNWESDPGVAAKQVTYVGDLYTA